MSSESQDKDVFDLNAHNYQQISSEERDGGGDHVGAEEGGGVDHELVRVVVPVVAADDRREELEDELGVGGGEVAKEDCVADGADVSADTDAEDGGVNLFESHATVGHEAEDGKTGNGEAGGD